MTVHTKPAETSIDVSVWDDQTGAWFDLTEAATQAAARERIAWYVQQDVRDGYEKRRYCIRTTIIEEVGTEAEVAAARDERDGFPASEAEEVAPETDLTPGSLELFLGLAEDASNWSGTPLVTVSAAGKGHLTDLKKRGLLDTFVDEGCSFAVFTEAGIALAVEHGIEADYLRHI